MNDGYYRLFQMSKPENTVTRILQAELMVKKKAITWSLLNNSLTYLQLPLNLSHQESSVLDNKSRTVAQL